MNPTEIYPKLVSAVDRILKFVSQNKNAKLITLGVSKTELFNYRLPLTEQEAAHRQRSLEAFRNLPLYRKTSAQSYNAFVKSLYPAQNGLSHLKPSLFSKSQVNHSTLYKRYSDLPSPGVGHLRSDDLEEFMAQMLNNRVFSKPNVLSSSTISTYNEGFVLKQYYKALAYRKEHLRKLWHITKDMEEAGIPLTDYERRQMVFMTFYRDRPDIIRQIRACKAHLSDKNPEHDLDNDLPQFEWKTYSDLLALDPQTYANIDFFNTLLFCALRHENWKAEESLLKQIGIDNFTRDTYKILLDNYAMLGRKEQFVFYLDILSSKHPYLLDIKLLNIIIRSICFLGYPELSERLVVPFFEHGGKLLSEENSFLKLLTYTDRLEYSAYLKAYDQKHSSSPIKLCATERTFLPLLEHYCVTGADFSHILNLLFYIEVGWELPLSSVLFKLLFRAFSLNNYNPADLQIISAKLIEQHDKYYDFGDSWIKERINQTSIPPNASSTLLKILEDSVSKHAIREDGAMLKFSNGLTRLIFKAYYTAYKDDAVKTKKISAIESKLQNKLVEANALTILRLEDELQPGDLNQRSELTYLKKASVLELLDI